jgi:DNA-binding NarL/FixJ family response regulator
MSFEDLAICAPDGTMKEDTLMVNKIKNKLQNIVYYNDDHSKSPVCTSELSEINGATWTLPSTWQELTKEIESGEDKIVFHIDMIIKSGENIKDFIKSLKTLIKFMPGNKPLKIVVLTTPTTTQQQIQELKDANILGIGYDTIYYSFEQAAEATAALIAGKPYWPEHIISQLPIEEKKPVQIYFRSPSGTDVTKVDPNVVTDYNKILPVDVITCDSWDELDMLLGQQPHQLSIHANVFALTDISYISETLKILQKRLKVLRLEIPIAIVVEKTTPRSLIEKAKESGIQGLIPYHGDWDNIDIMQGLDALTNRITHWPEHIINQLPIDKPVHVVFRKNWEVYIKSNIADAVKNNPLIAIRCCSEWNELGEILKDRPNQIAVHVDMIGSNSVTVHEFFSMLDTLIKISIPDGNRIPIAVIIEKTTNISLVKEIQKTDVLGIIPSSVTFDISESIKGVDALSNRIPYWPKYILEQLPGAKKTITKNTITITPRQAQIADLILERGLSNKRIKHH